MVFLVDHILQGRVMPAWVQEMVQRLPGPATVNYLIGWSVAATVVLFLLSWAVSLLMTYHRASALASGWFTTSPRICLRGCKTLAFHARACGRRYDPESDGRLRECRHDSEMARCCPSFLAFVTLVAMFL